MDPGRRRAGINDRAAEEYFRRGQESENQGQHEKALEFYERALNENPDHESACFRLAVLYDRRAEDAKAISAVVGEGRRHLGLVLAEEKWWKDHPLEKAPMPHVIDTKLGPTPHQVVK